MSNTKKISILCLFLSIATFFSCGDVIDTSLDALPESNTEITYLCFVKISIEPYYKMPLYEEITECMIGDTIGLACGVDWLNRPKSVTARISTLRRVIGFVKLFEDDNAYYLDGAPCRYVAHIATFQDENVLTAEIKTKDTILQTTLNVRSK